MSAPFNPAYPIGQAVFIRTDVADFTEESIPFKTLEEMIQVCSVARPNLSLDKIVVYALNDGVATSLTLGFNSCSNGLRPGPVVV